MRQYKKGIEPKDIIVRCGCDSLLPFSLLFGFYIIAFGTVSPGGGFQGGVIVSASALMLYLGYGGKGLSKSINGEFIRVNEAIGATIYICLALVGVFVGSYFAENVFFNLFNVGDPLSAGNVTFMGYVVGFKVLTGVGFLLLTMIGLLMEES